MKEPIPRAAPFPLRRKAISRAAPASAGGIPTILLVASFLLVSCSFACLEESDDQAALWARSVESAAGASCLHSVAVDSAGNAHAAGSLYGTDLYRFGGLVWTRGPGDSEAALLVTYDAAGRILGEDLYDLGNDVAANGVLTAGFAGSMVIVRYQGP